MASKSYIEVPDEVNLMKQIPLKNEEYFRLRYSSDELREPARWIVCVDSERISLWGNFPEVCARARLYARVTDADQPEIRLEHRVSCGRVHYTH